MSYMVAETVISRIANESRLLICIYATCVGMYRTDSAMASVRRNEYIIIYCACVSQTASINISMKIHSEYLRYPATIQLLINVIKLTKIELRYFIRISDTKTERDREKERK